MITKFLYTTFCVFVVEVKSTTVGPSFSDLFTHQQTSEQNVPNKDIFNISDISREIELLKKRIEETQGSKTLDSVDSLAADVARHIEISGKKSNEEWASHTHIFEFEEKHKKWTTWQWLKFLKISIGVVCTAIALTTFCYRKFCLESPESETLSESALVTVEPDGNEEEQRAASDPKIDTPPPSYDEAVGMPRLASSVEQLSANRQNNQNPP